MQPLQYETDGYAVIENFVSDAEVTSLKDEMHRIVEEMNPEDHPRSIFSTHDEKQVRFDIS